MSIHDERNRRRAEHFGLVEEKPKADEGPDLSEFHTGGGWYEIDGEKYHGKVAALEALNGAQ